MSYQNFQTPQSSRSASFSPPEGAGFFSPPPGSATVTHQSGIGIGPPPSYDEANNPNAPPPSYDSLFGRVREVHKSSNGLFDFLKKLFLIIIGTIGCTIVIGVTIVVPVAMIVIGGTYFDDCPAEEHIPVYLIVGGCIALFKQLLSLQGRMRQTEDEDSEYTFRKTVDSLISFFLLGWFVTGCFWVYRIYEPDYEHPKSPLYCDVTLYLFAFWLLNAVFIILGVLTAFLCCASAVAMCVAQVES